LADSFNKNGSPEGTDLEDKNRPDLHKIFCVISNERDGMISIWWNEYNKLKIRS
jgi:hypothetical protein